MIYYDLYHPKVEVFSSPTTATPMERLTSMVYVVSQLICQVGPLSRYALFNAYRTSDSYEVDMRDRWS
jgi:hypothetical protein